MFAAEKFTYICYDPSGNLAHPNYFLYINQSHHTKYVICLNNSDCFNYLNKINNIIQSNQTEQKELFYLKI